MLAARYLRHNTAEAGMEIYLRGHDIGEDASVSVYDRPCRLITGGLQGQDTRSCPSGLGRPLFL